MTGSDVVVGSFGVPCDFGRVSPLGLSDISLTAFTLVRSNEFVVRAYTSDLLTFCRSHILCDAVAACPLAIAMQRTNVGKPMKSR